MVSSAQCKAHGMATNKISGGQTYRRAVTGSLGSDILHSGDIGLDYHQCTALAAHLKCNRTENLQSAICGGAEDTAAAKRSDRGRKGRFGDPSCSGVCLCRRSPRPKGGRMDFPSNQVPGERACCGGSGGPSLPSCRRGAPLQLDLVDDADEKPGAVCDVRQAAAPEPCDDVDGIILFHISQQ